MTPTTSPAARLEPAMAYDGARGRVLLFGGTDSSFSTWFADTWEYGPISAECAITRLDPPDGSSYGWRQPAPTFTWRSTCDMTYRLEFSNRPDFRRPGLLVFPGHALHGTSFTPNHGMWMAIGNLAKHGESPGTIYWRVLGYGPANEKVLSVASSIRIDQRYGLWRLANLQGLLP